MSWRACSTNGCSFCVTCLPCSSVRVRCRNRVFDRLFEAAEIAKFNPKELGEYWESLKNFRDWYSVMSTQLKKGVRKVLKKVLKGRKKEECFKMQKKNETGRYCI